jgi:hypothetical protein
MQQSLEAAIYEYWLSVQSFDPQRFAANFAPDGTLEDPVGVAPVRGREEIAALYATGIRTLSRITPRIKAMYVGVGQSTEVAVRWELAMDTKLGKHGVVKGIGLFKFAPFQPGDRLQLESVREFFDPAEFTSFAA